MTAAARRHMQRVAELGCILCKHIGYGYSPAQVHHVFDTADRSDFLVVPLCEPHHTGPGGFHRLGERKFNRIYKTSETKLLAMTLEALAK